MNLKLWQQKNETNMQVVERATHFLKDLKSAQIIWGSRDVQTNTSQLDSNRHVMIRWEKPVTGRCKCNIDASFSSSMNKVGIEIFVMMLRKTVWFSPLCDVDIGEAMGLHTALELT